MSENVAENRSDALERVPATAEDRSVPGRPTRAEIVAYWEDRFGVPRSTFEGVTFWEKGAGRIWALAHELEGPIEIEALGLPVLRTRQEFWKPTTDAARRFGTAASANVIQLTEPAARRFLAGADQDLDWDGDWGYLLVAREAVDKREIIGVGRYTYGTLSSMLPKGQRREFGEGEGISSR
jgi:NOL1/NOP2/fmu family ribosome biogenesis protein